jgi:excisionase family DNA binding protein
MPRRNPASVLPERHLISTTTAAEYLDVSPGTIRQYIADGKLRCLKVGRLIKIDARDLEALIFTVDNS